MLVICLEEVIHELLHLLDIPIIDGSPGILYDPVDLPWVCGVSAWLVWCVWVRWSLDGLHGLCVLLFDGSVDMSLAVGAMESVSRGMPGLLIQLLILSLKALLVLLV